MTEHTAPPVPSVPSASLIPAGVMLRPLADESELPLFTSLPYVLDEELAGDLDAGRRHTSWLWMALHDGRVVARAGWWARQRGDGPMLLDVFDIDADTGADNGAGTGPGIGAALLEAAMAQLFPDGRPRPDYGRYLTPGWHEDREEARAVAVRTEALARTGARPLVERLRLEWVPAAEVPAASARLRFREVACRAELVELMTSVLDGTLDAHSRRDLAAMSAERCAREQYDGELARYRSPRQWWRVATLPTGEPVGFVVPARNAYGPIIAYLGVLPAHRGRGYADDVLAEGTRVLAASGARRVRASTDVANAPMAAAFARAGYETFQRELTMEWAQGAE
ncbi:GNAT family N-acetyltransferase [Streptomyces sp. NRRL F-5126]|uniref:GNAT family N-acetyltransferase n=1 Tax=Streptomyces sp. NRRL F-5126 TaxID=1463857 RepID=UPI00069066CC|nr:GNAT family N-acetyltransferase [Streptomyces sp. NRRL F-5126]